MKDMFEKQLSPGNSNHSSSNGQSGDDQEGGSLAVPKNGSDALKNNSWFGCCPRGHMGLNTARMVIQEINQKL